MGREGDSAHPLPLARSSSSFPRRAPSLDDFCYGISAMEVLARQGSWRSVSEKALHARKLSLLQFPHEHLAYRAYLVLAAMKLRNYGVAADELEALGDLDGPAYRYEHHPELYPAKSGSMVPFALRWLQALLPHRLGEPSRTIELLYALLHHCRDRICSLQLRAGHHQENNQDDNQNQGKVESISESTSSLSLGPPPAQKEDASVNLWDELKSSPVVSPDSDQEFGEFVSGGVGGSECKTAGSASGSLLDRWQHREELVMNTILSFHLNQKEFVLVLKWLKQMIDKRPHDPFLHSKLAYVQMQLGDLNGAENTFSKVESMVSDVSGSSSSNIHLKGLVSRNRGIHYLVSKQYGAAVKEFDAAIQLDETDVVAANNKALCLMYSKDLIGSTKVLESVLEKQPVVALSESLVLNLCSMYELAFVHNAGIKKSLTEWIMKVAPDDFDLSCTRL